MSTAAIFMAVLLIRASLRVEAVPASEINQYSLSPYVKKLRNKFFEAIYNFLIAFFKGILHALASLSKHTHLISTRSIAKIEKAINSAEEDFGHHDEKDQDLIGKKEEEKIPD